MDASFWVERTAQSIAKYGTTYLSISEEMALQNDSQFYNAVMARVDEIRAEKRAKQQSPPQDNASKTEKKDEPTTP